MELEEQFEELQSMVTVQGCTALSTTPFSRSTSKIVVIESVTDIQLFAE